GTRGRRGGRQGVDVQLDQSERAGPGDALGGERTADVRVLLRHDDDAEPAPPLEVRHHRAVDGELAREERYRGGERRALAPAGDEESGRDRERGRGAHGCSGDNI